MKWDFWRHGDGPAAIQPTLQRLSYAQYRIVVEPIVRQVLDDRGYRHEYNATVETILRRLWDDREEDNFGHRLLVLVNQNTLNPSCYIPLVIPHGYSEAP